MLFASLIAGAQTVYYTQDFEAGVPLGWTATGQWEWGNAAAVSSQYFNVPDHTNFMGFNDDALGNGTIASGRITTGPIDLTAASGALTLNFQSFFINGDFQGADETGKISVSTDNGATWTEIYNLDVTGGDWQQAGFLLPYAGQTILLAFDYDDGGGWNYGWCIDDIAIQSAIAREVSFEYLNREAFVGGGFVGGSVYPGGTIKNNGTDAITSIDLSWSVNGGAAVTETITGINIPFGGVGLIESSTPFTIADGSSNIAVWVSNLNGTGDDSDVSNNDGGTFTITSETANADKGVVVEEATGTWCGWCPRGTVFLDLMTKRYPGHFIGIAVHNADPMVLAEYDDAVGNFPGFSGYPSVIFNRVNILDPSEIENPFLTAVNVAPPARLEVGAEYNSASRELTVSVGAEFLQNIGAGYKLNAILIEDDVTGTGSTYAQANYYSGGGVGPMGGYELLPGSVPAADMVYDHVGRALLGGFGGATGSVPDAVEAGKWAGHTFNTFTLPNAWDVNSVHIVGVLTNASGQIVNAISSSIDEAVENGIFVNSTKEVVNNDLISVAPNPFTSVTNVTVNLESSKEVSMKVYDAVGKLIASRSYGEMVGSQVLPFDGTNLNAGMYLIQVTMGDTIATKRVYLSK